MILTVSAYKGGVGKTTTSIHVAGALGLEKPTLLIDIDRIQGAVRWYRKGSDWSFDAVAEIDASIDVFQRYRREGHVVFDTPAAPTFEELVLFGKRSDLILVPTTPDALAIDALVETLLDLKRERLPFRVVLVQVPPAPSKEGERAREEFRAVGLPVLEAEIPRAAAFQHAARQGRLVRDVRDRRAADLWTAYQRVADEALEAGGAA
jgi:chromosome partitioning protein